MAKVSFVNPDATGPSSAKEETTQPQPAAEATAAPVKEAEVVQEAPAPAAEASTEIVPAAEAGSPSTFLEDEGDIGLGDIIMPRINLVQKVGPLSEEFTPGDIVLNKELVIFSFPPKGKESEAKPIEFTVLGFRPTIYTERVPGGALGRNAKTPQEVRALGGTTDYDVNKRSAEKGEEIPLFQQLSTALVLIKRPEGIDEEGIHFTYEHDGVRYALAQWSMKGAAFTAGAKVIKTARRIGHLARGGYTSYPYSMTTRIKNYGGNPPKFAVIPVLRPGKKHSPEFKAFADSVLNAPAEDSEAVE